MNFFKKKPALHFDFSLSDSKLKNILGKPVISAGFENLDWELIEGYDSGVYDRYGKEILQECICNFDLLILGKRHVIQRVRYCATIDIASWEVSLKCSQDDQLLNQHQTIFRFNDCIIDMDTYVLETQLKSIKNELTQIAIKHVQKNYKDLRTSIRQRSLSRSDSI